MREIDSGKGMAEVARMDQLSPKRLETWRSECRAKGERAFAGKGAQPQTKLDAEPISELKPRIGQHLAADDGNRFLKKKRCSVSGNIPCQSPSMPVPTL
jgi:hypothetical protein